MEEHWIIRAAAARDLYGVKRVDRESFAEELRTPPFLLRQQLDVFGSLFVVAAGRGSDQVQGYTVSGLAPSGATGWILSLAVGARWRRQGLGRALTETALVRLRESGADHVKLTVDPENAGAVALYCSIGFQSKGTYADYFGDGQARSVMEYEYP